MLYPPELFAIGIPIVIILSIAIVKAIEKIKEIIKSVSYNKTITSFLVFSFVLLVKRTDASASEFMKEVVARITSQDDEIMKLVDKFIESIVEAKKINKNK